MEKKIRDELMRAADTLRRAAGLELQASDMRRDALASLSAESRRMCPTLDRVNVVDSIRSDQLAAYIESVVSPLTKQEIFDRAWRGLSSQGFQRCRVNDRCAYSDGNGRHCAWGWVDVGLGVGSTLAIYEMRRKLQGVAALLDDEGLDFAEQLQEAHDSHEYPEDMERALRELAADNSLSIPGDTAPTSAA